tara:strand:- start:72 stop:521 length:450 start_codon:yes stop_codon:yes gene_type:complete
MIIPTYICYIIWEYSGNETIILNKDLINLLDEKKQKFIDDPLIIDYRLAKFKESRSTHSSVYKRRPSVLVEKWEEVKLTGKYMIDIVKDTNKIVPSNELREHLIPVSLAKAIHNREMEYEYYYRVTYWKLYEIFTKDIKRAKLYMMLFK